MNIKSRRNELLAAGIVSALIAIGFAWIAMIGDTLVPLWFSAPFILTGILLVRKSKAPNRVFEREKAAERKFAQRHPALFLALEIAVVLATLWSLLDLFLRFAGR